MNALLTTYPAFPSAGPSVPNQRALAAAWGQDLAAQAEAGELSVRTVGAYLSNVDAWLDWLDARAQAAPMPADVRAYVAHLRARLRPGSVNTNLAAIRAFYAWAETENAYPAIARSVKGLKNPTDGPLDCLNRSQVAGLLDLVDGESLVALRDRALVHVLFCTALRLVSLTGCDVGDLDAARGELVYRGKGDPAKGRRAILSPSALGALLDYLDARGQLAPDAPLFAAVGNRAGGHRLTARSVRRVLVGMMERAGHVQRQNGHQLRPGVLSAHSLRRSGITAAGEMFGMDAAQALAGHKDRRTTEKHYARVQQGRLLRDVAAGLDLGRSA
jgi:site-specific recombinase XerD